MTIASIIFGCLIASIFGCAFHFWRGESLARLILYNLLAWAGFWIGHLVGKNTGITFIQIGPIDLGTAIIGTILVLFLGYWLSSSSQGKSKG